MHIKENVHLKAVVHMLLRDHNTAKGQTVHYAAPRHPGTVALVRLKEITQEGVEACWM